MSRTIEYILVTLIAISLATVVGIATSRYLSAQFEQAKAPFEARQ